MNRGDLRMCACRRCGFVYNGAFDLAKMSYDEHYDNTQTCSSYFNNYVDDLAESIIHQHNVRNCRIIEVGCGKGTFLRKLLAIEPSNTGIGFDPAFVGAETELDGRLQFKTTFYGPEYASVEADVIVCRHVIEHIPNPVEFAQTIHAALANSPHAKIFFETPCVEWILQNQVIWDFFYEHCSIFTTESLRTLFERVGFDVTEARHIFGGQYLWLEAKVAGASKQNVSYNNLAIPSLAEKFAQAEETLRKHWLERVKQLHQRGTVAIWGAGAKGVTLANLVDPKRELIDCVIDLNPVKQGNYLPGTGHPILNYPALGERKITSAVLTNPNYYQENVTLLQAAHIFTELIEKD